MVYEDAALSHEGVELLRRQPGRERRVDLVQLLGGHLQVLIDRRLEVVHHVEGHVGDGFALHHILGDLMNVAEILLEVRRLVHLNVLADLGDDIHQELSAHHDEIIDVGDERDGGHSIGVQDEDGGPALNDGEVQMQELGLELLVPEVSGVRMAVQRLEQLTDRVTEASSPMLGPPGLRETDVRLRPLHGSLRVGSDTVALQQLRVLDQGEGHEQDSASSHCGWDSPNLLKDRPLTSRCLDLVARHHDAALVLLGVLVF